MADEVTITMKAFMLFKTNKKLAKLELLFLSSKRWWKPWRISNVHGSPIATNSLPLTIRASLSCFHCCPRLKNGTSSCSYKMKGWDKMIILSQKTFLPVSEWGKFSQQNSCRRLFMQHLSAVFLLTLIIRLFIVGLELIVTNCSSMSVWGSSVIIKIIV